MDQKQVNFTRLMDDDLINHEKNVKNQLIPNKKRDNIKKKLIDKYHVSDEESEKILSFLEKKYSKNLHNNQIHDFDSNFGNLNIKNTSQKNNSESKKYVKENGANSFLDSNDKVKSKQFALIESKPANEIMSNIIPDNDGDIYHVSEEEAENTLSFLEEEYSKNFHNDNTEIHNLNSNDKVKSTQFAHKESKEVDEIISDIIPDYKEDISIELENVNLAFDIIPERIDTLKEEFINSFKINKVKKTKLHVLKDITFKIFSGEKVGIVGYNGSGKSTLLKVISGIYPPDRGSVKINGNISPLLSLGAGFDYNYSGRRNIFLNGAVLGYDKEFLNSKVDEIIEFSELGSFIDIPIKNYSAGMIAKLAFSIATILEPKILIIDEILAVGDVNFRKKSQDKIKSLMGGDTTVLFVSHSIPQVREICDKVIWIDKGKVREIGEVNKVCDSYLKDAEKASNEEVANIQFR